MSAHRHEAGPRPYWNPYLAGVLLGLTLLATFVVAGQGLGASAFPKRSLCSASAAGPPFTGNRAQGNGASAQVVDGLVVQMIPAVTTAC